MVDIQLPPYIAITDRIRISKTGVVRTESVIVTPDKKGPIRYKTFNLANVPCLFFKT